MHLLKPPIAIPILILCSFTATAHAADARYSGSASLTKPTASTTANTSPLSISVDLRPASSGSSAGRFEMNAHLQTGQAPNGNSCGTVADLIFRNGFGS